MDFDRKEMEKQHRAYEQYMDDYAQIQGTFDEPEFGEFEKFQPGRFGGSVIEQGVAGGMKYVIAWGKILKSHKKSQRREEIKESIFNKSKELSIQLGIYINLNILDDIIDTLLDHELEDINKECLLVSYASCKLNQETYIFEPSNAIIEKAYNVTNIKFSKYDILRYVDFIQEKLKLIRLKKLYEYSIQPYITGEFEKDEHLYTVYLNIILNIHNINKLIRIDNYKNAHYIARKYGNGGIVNEAMVQQVIHYHKPLVDFINSICSELMLNVNMFDTYMLISSSIIDIHHQDNIDLPLKIKLNDVIPLPQIVNRSYDKIKIEGHPIMTQIDRHFFNENQIQTETQELLLELLPRYGFNWI